jgi:hypothetical protein
LYATNQQKNVLFLFLELLLSEAGVAYGLAFFKEIYSKPASSQRSRFFVLFKIKSPSQSGERSQ